MDTQIRPRQGVSLNAALNGEIDVLSMYLLMILFAQADEVFFQDTPGTKTPMVNLTPIRD
jgi:hypothetical protein